VSAFVICLVVVGAAIAYVYRTSDHDKPATESGSAGRDPGAEAAPGAKQRRSPEEATGAVDLPVAQRLRSGVLLALLLTGLGALAALGVGFMVVVLLTVVRTAIG
jgi:hypothetical protein